MSDESSSQPEEIEALRQANQFFEDSRITVRQRQHCELASESGPHLRDAA